MAEYSLVLFDGGVSRLVLWLISAVCNMCNTFALFVIARDKKAIFRFASLQSSLGQATIKRLGIANDLSTVVLVEPGDLFFTK